MSQTAVSAREVRRDEGLRRGIGPVALAAAIVNIVVGAGIFSLPAGMARAAGPYALIAYAVCGVAMAAVVLCCAEAGSRVPTSGGIYGYVDAAFGPLAGFVAGVLLWLSCVLACGGIAAALASAVGALAPALAGPAPRAGIIVVAIGALMAVNATSVRTASRVISWATAVKLVPLILFLAVGLFFIDPAKLSAGAAAPDIGGIGRAVILSLFAFQGMETVLGANGEVDNPAKTLPRALIGAMAFIAVLYVAIQLVAQGLLGPGLAASTTPLANAIGQVDPRLRLLLLVGAAISMFGWIGSDLLGAPRVLFAFARDGFLPGLFGRVSASGAPRAAIVAHGIIAMILGVTGTFDQLAVLSVLAACALYMGACAAAWRLDRRGTALLGAPLKLPLLGVWVGVGLISMAVVIVLARPVEIGGLVAAIALSVGLYALARRLKPARA